MDLKKQEEVHNSARDNFEAPENRCFYFLGYEAYLKLFHIYPLWIVDNVDNVGKQMPWP